MGQTIKQQLSQLMEASEEREAVLREPKIQVISLAAQLPGLLQSYVQAPPTDRRKIMDAAKLTAEKLVQKLFREGGANIRKWKDTVRLLGESERGENEVVALHSAYPYVLKLKLGEDAEELAMHRFKLADHFNGDARFLTPDMYHPVIMDQDRSLLVIDDVKGHTLSSILNTLQDEQHTLLSKGSSESGTLRKIQQIRRISKGLIGHYLHSFEHWAEHTVDPPDRMKRDVPQAYVSRLEDIPKAFEDCFHFPEGTNDLWNDTIKILEESSFITYDRLIPRRDLMPNNAIISDENLPEDLSAQEILGWAEKTRIRYAEVFYHIDLGYGWAHPLEDPMQLAMTPECKDPKYNDWLRNTIKKSMEKLGFPGSWVASSPGKLMGFFRATRKMYLCATKYPGEAKKEMENGFIEPIEYRRRLRKFEADIRHYNEAARSQLQAIYTQLAKTDDHEVQKMIDNLPDITKSHRRHLSESSLEGLYTAEPKSEEALFLRRLVAAHETLRYMDKDFTKLKVKE